MIPDGLKPRKSYKFTRVYKHVRTKWKMRGRCFPVWMRAPNGRKLGINHTHTWKKKKKGESRLLSREWDHNIITVILGKQKLRPSTLIRRIFVMGKPKKKKSNFRRRRRRRSFDIKGDSDTSPDQMKAGERSCGHLIHAYPPHPQSLSRTHTHQLLPSCHCRPVWKTTSNRTTKIFSHIK